MDGTYTMVPRGEYRRLCELEEREERMRELADSGDMPDYDAMDFEQLVGCAQWMWMRMADMRCAMKCALADMRDIASNMQRFTEGGDA